MDVRVTSSREGNSGLSDSRSRGTGDMRLRIMASGIGGALVLLGILVYFTPVFEIREDYVEVTGTESLSRERVLKALRVRNGMKMARLNPAFAVQRLKRDPWIRNARVMWKIPSGLRVEIQERRLWAAWLTNEFVFQVSDDGILLDVGYRANPGTGVTVRDRRRIKYRVPVKIGMEIDDLWGYPLARPLAEMMGLTGTGQVTIDETGKVTARRNGGGVVKFGRASELRATSEVVRRIPKDLWPKLLACRKVEYDWYGYVVVSECNESVAMSEDSDDQRATGADL